MQPITAAEFSSARSKVKMREKLSTAEKKKQNNKLRTEWLNGYFCLSWRGCVRLFEAIPALISLSAVAFLLIEIISNWIKKNVSKQIIHKCLSNIYKTLVVALPHHDSYFEEVRSAV